MMLAFLAMLLYTGTSWRPFHAAAWAAFGVGLLAIGIGFAMRVLISGRAPVTNMYESVIYLALGVSLFGCIFELIYRRRYILTAAAALATVALILADNCPAALDPSLQPLQPVLRSNFWLVTHVMTITLSYAAFRASAGNRQHHARLLPGRIDEPSHGRSADEVHVPAAAGGRAALGSRNGAGRSLGGLLVGSVLGLGPQGGLGADRLAGLLGGAPRCAMPAGSVDFGLAALSVLCFALVVMAWYGVNFVLGAGLHSYGFGGGGQSYVLSAIALQALYVWLPRSAGQRRTGPSA